MYDTPPSGRWQRPSASSLGEDDGIYDTPRSIPPQADSETEVKTNTIMTRFAVHSFLERASFYKGLIKWCFIKGVAPAHNNYAVTLLLLTIK